MFCLAQQAEEITTFFEQADALLQEYVVDGNVDYEKLQEIHQLDDLITFISQYNYLEDSETVQKAYLINVITF